MKRRQEEGGTAAEPWGGSQPGSLLDALLRSAGAADALGDAPSCAVADAAAPWQLPPPQHGARKVGVVCLRACASCAPGGRGAPWSNVVEHRSSQGKHPTEICLPRR